MKRRLFDLLVYSSVVFLFVYLFKQDFFNLKSINFKIFPLLVSVILLWAGFILSGISWWNVLNQHKINISINQAVTSHGMAVFTKYIPGKIWSIIGRAGNLKSSSYSLKVTTFLSLKEQVIYIWEGLILSAIPMLVIYGLNIYVILVVLLSFLITALLFIRKIHDWFIKTFKRILKRDLEVPFLNFSESLKIIQYVFYYWIIWLLAFYLFVNSFYPEIGVQVAFAFSLSVTLGLLAIVFPAGLGVREGVMGSYLILAGVPVEISAVIVIYARIWFITGEIFLFFLAVLLKFLKRN